MEENEESTQYNKDELVPPDFLNKEFFQNVLRKAENDNTLEITDLDMIPGTKPGEHFLSIMFKANIYYSSKEKTVNLKSLVVKTLPVEDGTKKEMLKTLPVFDREIKMYTEFLPEMKRIMLSIGDDEEIAPSLIYHCMDPPILIFENITKLGYETNTGFFDFDKTDYVLRKLAKFHAVSFYINDNKYNHRIDLKKYTPMINSAVTETMKVFFDGFDYLKDEVINWPGYEKIVEKLSTQKHNFIEKLLKVYEPNPDSGFKVLCHGDYHMKNMMFIRKEGKIEKTMVLDYQLSFWASPAYDLIYLLYAFGDAEVRKRRSEILLTYHEEFCNYLNRLGCLRKPPTLLDLNIEMLKLGILELLWSVCYLPFYCMDFSKVETDAVVDPTPEAMANMRKIMYRNEEIVALLKEVLPELLYKGILS